MLDERRNHKFKPIPKGLRDKLAICHEHPSRVLFLDIETTGLSHFYDEITIVGWAYSGKSGTFIKGQQPTRLHQVAQQAVAVVTFNGIRFDQRFLRDEFPDIRLPEAHIDLMYLCRRVGLTVREAARLQTFPDNYFFRGNRTQQFVQVGNAVPPFLALQIGEGLVNLLKKLES